MAADDQSKRKWSGIKACVAFCHRKAKSAYGYLRKPSATLPVAGSKQIEDYPMGYPRFSRLLGAHVAFSISRRFSVLRSRLLLIKQDHVSLLESQLDKLDQSENRPIYLASLRRDRNGERGAVMRELDAALKDYDGLLERNARILQLPTANRRNKRSLRNWIEANGSICAQEASFLHESDLCTAEKVIDGGINAVECCVERTFIRFCNVFRKSPASSVSRDKDVFIFTGPATKVLTRLLITWLIFALLMIPVILMRTFRSSLGQVLCVLMSSGLFILILSSVMNAKASEIFIAGPTYAALLVVFISGNRSG